MPFLPNPSFQLINGTSQNSKIPSDSRVEALTKAEVKGKIKNINNEKSYIVILRLKYRNANLLHLNNICIFIIGPVQNNALIKNY
jgi:hypothetical protein